MVNVNTPIVCNIHFHQFEPIRLIWLICPLARYWPCPRLFDSKQTHQCVSFLVLRFQYVSPHSAQSMWHQATVCSDHPETKLSPLISSTSRSFSFQTSSLLAIPKVGSKPLLSKKAHNRTECIFVFQKTQHTPVSIQHPVDGGECLLFSPP